MASLVFRITGDPASFKSAMGEVSSSLDKANKRAESLSASLGRMGNTLSIGVTAPIIAMGVGVVRAAADMESLRLGLASVATASDTTEKQLARLKEVAKLPGLGFKEAIQGSISLQSAGFSAQLAERSLKAFGNALATVGKGKADLDGVSLALSQIASKGKISAEEINQLAERVPQIRKAIQAAFGTADTEVLQRAGIGATEFVERVVTELEKLKQVAGGTKNLFENLQDALLASADRIGTKLLPAVNEVIPRIEKLVALVADGVDAFTKLPEPIQATGLAIAGVIAIAGPALKLFTGLSTALIGLQGYLVASGTAIASAGGVAAANTSAFAAISLAVGALALKLTAVASAAYLAYAGLQLFNALRKEAEATNNLSFATETLLQRVRKAHPEIGALELQYRNGTLSLEAFNAEVLRLAKTMESATTQPKKTAEAVKGLGQDVQKASNIIKVSSVADLIYVESLERIKTAVGKVKDVMYEWSIQGTAIGKQIETWKAPISALALEFTSMSGAIATATENLKMMENLRPPQIEITNQGASRRGSVLETVDILGGDSSMSRASKVAQAEQDLQRIKQLNQEGKATGNDVIEAQIRLKKAQEDTGTAAQSSGKKQSAALQQVSLALNDFGKGLNDALWKSKTLGEALKSVALSSAQSITRLLIDGALKSLGDAILGVGNTAGKVFGGIFGGGASATGSIFSAAGGGGPVLGAGSSGGAMAGGVSAGISGALGMVTGIASAVTGVIGLFQNAKLEGTMNQVERNTAAASIHLRYTLEKANEFWPYMKACWESLVRMEQRQMAVAGGGYNFDFRGATFGASFDQDAFAKNLIKTLKNNGF